MADLHLIGSELLPRRPMMRPLSRRCIAAGAYNQVTEPPNLESHTPIRSLVNPHPPRSSTNHQFGGLPGPAGPSPQISVAEVGLGGWRPGAALYELKAPQLTI